MRLLSILLLVGFLSAPAIADDEAQDIETAISAASQSGKPLIVEFHASWCAPCKAFEDTTLKDPRVQTALSNVMFVRYDIDDSAGSAASELYSVKSVPTLLVIDKFGVEQMRKSGALLGEPGIAEFLGILAKARDVASEEKTMRKQLHDKTDPGSKLVAAQWLVTHDHASEALPALDAVSVDKDATSAQRSAAVRAATHRRRTDVWKAQVIAEKTAIIKASPGDATDEDVLVATVESSLGSKERRELLDAVLDAHIDPERLNALVLIALAAHENETALKHAKRLAELRRDVPYVATFAECLQTVGQHEQATKLINEASEMAKWSPNYGDLLKARRRIFDSKGESPDVVATRVRAAEVWKRLELADEPAALVAKKEPSEDPRQAKWRQSFMQRMTLDHKLASACKAQANGAKLAVARLEIDAAGAITQKVWLLEPGASPAFQVCLDKELQGAVLTGPEVDAVLSVHFH